VNGQRYILEWKHIRDAAAWHSELAAPREAVKRYLVTEHQIPVYRMHAVHWQRSRCRRIQSGYERQA